MRVVLSIFLFMACALYSKGQDRKVYNSLLWEISGNGLSKPSYLYGTMHVSKKMVFNLSDSFFVALQNVDAVALEQNPAMWMEEMVQAGELMYKNPRVKLNGFDLYNAFLLDSLSEERLSYYLARYNGFANQLLYRNSRDKDFEEDTYLDLFIYQCAAKRGKKVIGLEKNEEVQKLNEKSQESAYKRDVDYYYYPDYGAMEDAYRKGDLNKLDSLQDLVYFGTDYRLYMLDTRNRLMVNKLDSILKTGLTVFTGAGAAHLPAEMGMIELLRKKGYTVRPVSQKSTDFAQISKRQMEDIIKPMEVVKYVAPDSSFQVSLPGKMYLVNQTKQYAEYFYPEMTNGTYYTISVFNTFNPLFGQNYKDISNKILELLYENIPGKIISREIKEKENEIHIYVTNETRKGDHQQYHIVVNQHTILMAKVSGTLSFGKTAEASNFVNSVQLLSRKAPNAFSAKNYTVSLPPGSFRENFSLSNVSGFDISSLEVESSDGYLALLKATYNELEYIEEDSFEVNFLLEKFALSNRFEIQNLKQMTLNGTAAVKCTLNRRGVNDLNALICLSGNDYFLLLANDAHALSIEHIANSINRHEPKRVYDTVYEDTLLKFKVKTDSESAKYNLSLKKYDKFNAGRYMGKYDLYFDFNSELQRYFVDSLTDESILVRRSSYDEYVHYKDANMFWRILDRRSKDDYVSIDEIEETELSGVYTLQRVIKSKNSIREIHEKYILRGRTLYSISVMGDTIKGISDRSKVFLESFEITDSTNQSSLFENRKSNVFENLVSEDSVLAVRALLAIRYIQFQAQDVSELVRLINDKMIQSRSYFIEFNPKEIFIDCLGRIYDDKAINALRELYYQNPDSSKLQAAVLMSLASGDSKKQFATIRSLLLSDVPYLQSGNIENLFKGFYKNLGRSSKLFPDILRLTRNQSYRQPVYVLLAEMLNKNVIKTKTIKPYIKDIVNDANEEIKKRLAADNNYGKYDYGYDELVENWPEIDIETMVEDIKELSGVDAFDDAWFINEFVKSTVPRFDLIEAYILILNKFNKHPGSVLFFQRMNQYLASSNQIRYQVRLIELGLHVNSDRIRELSENIESRHTLYQALKRINRLDLFDAKYLNQHDMALAIIAKSDRYGNSARNDSITFIEKRFTICKGNKKGYVYFFKRYDPKSKRTSLMHIGLMSEDDDKVDYFDVSKSAGRRLVYDTPEEINQMIEKVMLEFKLYNRNRSSMRNAAEYFEEYDDFFDY